MPGKPSLPLSCTAGPFEQEMDSYKEKQTRKASRFMRSLTRLLLGSAGAMEGGSGTSGGRGHGS